uniref:Uncharacterized protein n=1 Tax=Rhizophora mucronata TaxID=61149 RepID=A0A2P2N7M5_RHIMU
MICDSFSYLGFFYSQVIALLCLHPTSFLFKILHAFCNSFVVSTDFHLNAPMI